MCSRRRAELSENELIDAEDSYGLAGISGVFGASVQKLSFHILLKISEVPRSRKQT